jgi:hypothetical protein
METKSLLNFLVILSFPVRLRDAGGPGLKAGCLSLSLAGSARSSLWLTA